MKDVKIVIKNRKIASNKAMIFESEAKTNLQNWYGKVSSTSTAMYSYVLLGAFVLSFGVYVASMVGISVFAITERNYDFKTQQVLATTNDLYLQSYDADKLAVSSLDLPVNHVEHIYAYEQTGFALSR